MEKKKELFKKYSGVTYKGWTKGAIDQAAKILRMLRLLHKKKTYKETPVTIKEEGNILNCPERPEPTVHSTPLGKKKAVMLRTRVLTAAAIITTYSQTTRFILN